MRTYDMKWLLNKAEESMAIDFLFFWGHQPKEDGSLTEVCLSPWYDNKTSFEIDGVTYRSAEQWLKSEKARLFNDDEMVHRIRKAKTAAKADKLGRLVQPYDEKKWYKHARDLFIQGNLEKFRQNSELKRFLLDTGNRVIAEASPLDLVWGIGYARTNQKATLPQLWTGSNWSGFGLMEVRDQLRAES